MSVESVKGNATLWYSLHESFSDLVSNSCDAPLVALLIPAMATGEDIHIDGKISERLFYNLTRPYQRLLRQYIPTLHLVRINADNVSSDQTNRAAGVATGFSGGIDSYCVVADHYFSKVLDGFRITHLLFNNVGSHGRGGEKLFRERYYRLLPVTEQLGLPFIMTNSNLPYFYDQGLNHQKTHTLRNASVALLLQGGIGRYMYASAYNYKDILIRPYHDLTRCDAISVPLLSTEMLDSFSTGSEYTRVEKTLRVAEVMPSYSSLDVCANPNNTTGYTNCSTCSKCLRTLATLEIAGLIDHYSGVFDLNAYRSRRDVYFAKLLGSHTPLQKEIVQFAKQRNYSFPISARLAQPFFSLASLSDRGIRNLKHLIMSPP